MSRKRKLDVDELLNEGLGFIQSEFEKIKKLKSNEQLDRNSATTVKDFINALLAVKREARISAMDEELERMDNDQLKELAEQAVKYIKKESSNK